MAINNYIRPSLEVYQQLQATIQSTGDRMAACVVGVNYDVYSGGDGLSGEVAYAAGSMQFTLTYDNSPSYAEEVDLDTIELHGKDVLFSVGTVAAGGSTPIYSTIFNGTPPSSIVNASTLTALYFEDPFTLKIGKFTGSNNKVVASASAQKFNTDNASICVFADAGTAGGGTGGSIGYAAHVGDVIRLKVSEDDYRTATITSVTADTIKVGQPLVMDSENLSLTDLTLCESYTGKLSGLSEDASYTYEEDTTSNKITATGEAKIELSNKRTYSFLDGTGKTWIDYRVMLTPLSDKEDLFTITSVEDIQEYFGTISQKNDIAYACACALKGSAGRAIYALRTADHTAAAYKAALDKVERNAATYAFVILDSDKAVRDTVAEYIDKRSQPDMKRWCRALFGINPPGVTTLAESINCTLAPYEYTNAAGGNVLLTVNATHSGEQVDFAAMAWEGGLVPLYVGDIVVNGTDSYDIVEVVGSETLLLKGKEISAEDPNTNVTIKKAATPQNAGDYAAAIAEGLNNRRCSVVWCYEGTLLEVSQDTTTTSVIDNRYLAAEVAGISSAVVPQAPITRTEIQSITSATQMYARFTQKALDNIAKHGVLIITQDGKNEPCYIRHQLTTESDKGSLYYEESCTRNLDNISYAVTDVLEKYIGRSNVTPSALLAIKTATIQLLTEFTDDSTDPLIGPSLVTWEDLVVKQDPTFLDRVIITVKLYLPLPLNNIKVFEMAYAAEVTI